MLCNLTYSDWLDLITLVATLLALGFVYWQIRQVSVQLQLQHFADYTKRYQEIVLSFPESINEASFELKQHAERDKLMRQMRVYTDLCFEEWFLNQKFGIDKRIWAVWDGGMSTAFSKRAFREAWSEIKKDTRYGADFEQFIDVKAS